MNTGYLKGVRHPYSDLIKCWKRESVSFVYAVGDIVPSIEGHATYSVQLSMAFLVKPDSFPPKYVLVEENVITAVAKSFCLENFPVFDRLGNSKT